MQAGNLLRNASGAAGREGGAGLKVLRGYDRMSERDSGKPKNEEFRKMRRIMFRSKTTRFLKIAALLLPLVLFVGGAGAETGARKLTLMIYMCGSNLESQYGSATADIQEMLDAGVCGIALDEWTAADIVREQYAPYIS